MLVLAFVWLLLLVLELTRGESRLFYFLGTGIWAVFILDFAAKLILAPWPQTIEGRVLCIFLSLYAFGVFGYVTATLATFFVGRDADSDDAELAGAKQLALLRKEVTALRDEIRAMSQQPPES